MGGSGETLGVVLIIVLGLQPLSRYLQGFIDWEIVNPASSNIGWYWASLQSWTLYWMWPAAWLVMWVMQGEKVRSWLLLLVLALVSLGLPETSLWEIGVYTEEERWLIGLGSWYRAIGRGSVAAALAVAAVRWPALLAPAILLSALWIFS